MPNNTKWIRENSVPLIDLFFTIIGFRTKNPLVELVLLGSEAIQSSSVIK
jgi:hypothetical protein